MLGVRGFLHIHTMSSLPHFKQVGIESIVGRVIIGHFFPRFKASVGKQGGFCDGIYGVVWIIRIIRIITLIVQ